MSWRDFPTSLLIKAVRADQAGLRRGRETVQSCARSILVRRERRPPPALDPKPLGIASRITPVGKTKNKPIGLTIATDRTDKPETVIERDGTGGLAGPRHRLGFRPTKNGLGDSSSRELEVLTRPGLKRAAAQYLKTSTALRSVRGSPADGNRIRPAWWRRAPKGRPASL